MYSAFFHRDAQKFLSKQNNETAKGIYDKIEALAKDPFCKGLDIQKLGSKWYRIRIGKIRAIYEVDKEQARIEVLKIDYRGGIYKQFRNLFLFLMR